LDFWSSTMLVGVRWTISTSPKYLDTEVEVIRPMTHWRKSLLKLM
jgi:hypothetical protein